LKAAGFVILVAGLVWLPFEDTTIWLGLALAAADTVWLTVRSTNTLLQPLLVALIPLMALALMAFKSGVHGHGFADFTANQVWLLIQVWPLFILASAGYAIVRHMTHRHKRVGSGVELK
jgi:hypothetical protein